MSVKWASLQLQTVGHVKVSPTLISEFGLDSRKKTTEILEAVQSRDIDHSKHTFYLKVFFFIQGLFYQANYDEIFKMVFITFKQKRYKIF